jgi:hypothetical protein
MTLHLPLFIFMPRRIPGNETERGKEHCFHRHKNPISLFSPESDSNRRPQALPRAPYHNSRSNPKCYAKSPPRRSNACAYPPPVLCPPVQNLNKPIRCCKLAAVVFTIPPTTVNESLYSLLSMCLCVTHPPIPTDSLRALSPLSLAHSRQFSLP